MAVPSGNSAASISGADDFLALSKRLKAAGQTQLRKELHKGMREAAKPVIPKIRERARQTLPARGGLNERIAQKPYRSQVRTGATTAGVRITGGKVDPRINQGRVWHPVFGRRRPGATQNVPAAKGYFDETAKDEAPQIISDLRRVLVDFTNRLAQS